MIVPHFQSKHVAICCEGLATKGIGLFETVIISPNRYASLAVPYEQYVGKGNGHGRTIEM